jgi:hypothetical protein
MNATALGDLLERIENRGTTPEDAAFLRYLMNTVHYLPLRAEAFAARLRNPQAEPHHTDEFPGQRTGSAATVAIKYVRERLYTRGELVLQTIYRLEDGGTDQDRNRRIHVAEQVSHFISNLWDLLFDQAAAAAQYDPASIAIHLDLPDQFGDTRLYTRTVAELHAVVTGTAPNPADFA